MPIIALPPSALQASPEFKGIKTLPSVPCHCCTWLQASPEFKGIKTDASPLLFTHSPGFKPALNSKGLRPSTCRRYQAALRFKPALNSKGLRPFKAANFATYSSGFKPALNSKGLRPMKAAAIWISALQASPEFKGIKTVKDEGLFGLGGLQASPEFKGIKTA